MEGWDGFRDLPLAVLVGGVLNAFTGFLDVFACTFNRLAAGKRQKAEEESNDGAELES